MKRDTRRHQNWHPDIVRERIRVSMLINRLQNHVRGRVEMSPTQVRSAEILLRKRLPDLTAIEHSGEVITRSAVELPDEELARIASGSSDGAAEETASASEPAELH